jgi:hypothetical protein
MGWFNKKEERKDAPAQSSLPALPKLPELPELPPLKDREDDDYKESIHQLPSFPNSSFGEKFSQNTIKEAVTRSEKNDDIDFHYPEGKQGERDFDADDFVPQKKSVPMMPKPLPMNKPWNSPKKPMMNKEKRFTFQRVEAPEDFDFEEDEDFGAGSYEEPETNFRGSSRTVRAEPVFIRIDRFEAGLKTFEKAKRELTEIERVLKDISKIKEEEEKQLESWKNDIMKVKEQIDKVDQDIFSKLE